MNIKQLDQLLDLSERLVHLATAMQDGWDEDVGDFSIRNYHQLLWWNMVGKVHGIRSHEPEDSRSEDWIVFAIVSAQGA